MLRTHDAGSLNAKSVGTKVVLAGWVARRRDHGGVAFIDLRDSTGAVQVVINDEKVAGELRAEWCVLITGSVKIRPAGNENKEIATGEIEVVCELLEVLSEAAALPFPVDSGDIGNISEEVRLKYRYLDLRREGPAKNLRLRSKVTTAIRDVMGEADFLEIETPYLTRSTPEGARDFLVPSRLNPGKFYALPQAPQQFKQLIMVSGFDRYFQIAPCFRDEDARADRSPGEFYQLDIEMSFVEQEDVFQVVEPLLHEVFTKFSKGYSISKTPFKRFKYKDAMLKFGTDKPDLRNPIEISDVTEIFEREDVKLEIFKKLIQKKSVVRCVVAKNVSSKPRSFFDNLDKGAKTEGASGLGYIILESNNGKLEGKGPIAKFFSEDAINTLCKKINAGGGDAIFFICDVKKNAEKFSAWARTEIAKNLELIKDNLFEFCWVTDYPMFEYNEIDKKIDFSHNPFSMPQTPMDLIDKTDPLELLAYQYDIVCNGIELSSGAIRNHVPELMYKLFKIAGYSKEEVDNKFSGMINALSYGAPPHGGIAPGIDRIIMLLAGEKNIREVTMFPLNQNAQDLMMNAPSDVSEKQLKELNIKLVKKD